MPELPSTSGHRNHFGQWHVGLDLCRRLASFRLLAGLLPHPDVHRRFERCRTSLSAMSRLHRCEDAIVRRLEEVKAQYRGTIRWTRTNYIILPARLIIFFLKTIFYI